MKIKLLIEQRDLIYELTARVAKLEKALAVLEKKLQNIKDYQEYFKIR